MGTISGLEKFCTGQIQTVNESAIMAEEVVCNYYKMSDSQWLRLRYDIKSLTDLSDDEIVMGPFAQVVRYEGKPIDSVLGSSVYDFYKICLQDHSILSALKNRPEMELFPFALYILTHELIHVVRFCKFLQNFDASPDEKDAEEARVHQKTREILQTVRVQGIHSILKFYHENTSPLEAFQNC